MISVYDLVKKKTAYFVYKIDKNKNMSTGVIFDSATGFIAETPLPEYVIIACVLFSLRSNL
jgi:hypothetical protein